MEREMIRKAEKKDISRIAEILVFDKRIKYRPIFKDDAYCFGKLQILAVSDAPYCSETARICSFPKQ